MLVFLWRTLYAVLYIYVFFRFAMLTVKEIKERLKSARDLIKSKQFKQVLELVQVQNYHN